VIIITIGANESKPEEYFYGKNKNVITHLDFETDFEENKKVYIKGKNPTLLIKEESWFRSQNSICQIGFFDPPKKTPFTR